MSEEQMDPMEAVGDAASTAYETALGDGATPEAAFEAAGAAAQAAGTGAAEAAAAAASGGAETTASALSSAAAASTAADETPIGAIVTVGLGIGALLASVFGTTSS